MGKPKRKAARVAESLADQITHAGLPTPTPEFQFAKSLGRKWAFDYAWPDRLIALECEGAMFGGRVINVGVGAFEYRRKPNGERYQIPVPPHSIVRLGGRHNTGAGLLGDMEKYNHAAMLGWMVIRVTTTQVRDGEAVPIVKQAFEFRDRVCPVKP